MEQIRVEWVVDYSTLTLIHHSRIKEGDNLRITDIYKDRKHKSFYTERLVQGDQVIDTFDQPALQGTPKADANVYQFKPS